MVTRQVTDRTVTEDVPTENSCAYNVLVNEQDEYEVVDALGEAVFPIPNVPCNSERASSTVRRVLQHMANFKYFERIENRTPNPDLIASLTIEVENPSGDLNEVRIVHGKDATFILKNEGEEQLYVGIFDLRSSWEVKALTPESGFEILRGRTEKGDGILRKPLKMTVPDFLQKSGRLDCEDTIKLFVTSKPTYFRASLPDIRHIVDGEGYRDQGEDFSSLIENLNGGMRGQTAGTWITRSFLIRTIMEPSTVTGK